MQATRRYWNLELKINMGITIARNSTLFTELLFKAISFLLYMGDLSRINIPDLTRSIARTDAKREITLHN